MTWMKSYFLRKAAISRQTLRGICRVVEISRILWESPSCERKTSIFSISRTMFVVSRVVFSVFFDKILADTAGYRAVIRYWD